MEKLIYGLWRQPDEPLEPLEHRLLDDVAPELLRAGLTGLRINIEAPEAGSMRCSSTSRVWPKPAGERWRSTGRCGA